MSSIEHAIADCIRRGDYSGYQRARYPELGDGEEIIFTEEDFTGVDFRPFVIGFFIFKNCKLDEAVLSGYPITVLESSARGIDVRGSFVDITADESDFSDMRYDSRTKLGIVENRVASRFTNCTVDASMVKHFADQKVEFFDCHINP